MLYKLLIKVIFIFILLFIGYNFSSASYIYFYWQWCSHCAKVDNYFNSNELYKKYDIEKKEIYHNNENRELFIETWKKLWLSENDLWVPFMVSVEDNNYYIWDRLIINHFKSKVEINNNIENNYNINYKEKILNTNKEKTFLWFLIILLPAALADSINPCVFAVMLILLGSILNRYKSYKKMIFAWLLFISAIFISYYSMWLWIYKALSHTWSIFYLKLSVWILWLIVWLANIKDYFWYWKWFIMEVPLCWRPKLKKILDKITSPIWAFFVWFIVSLFLLPCTSWPYFTILWFLASESNSINMLWYIYLFIYNFVFILPMVLIIFLVALWTKTVSELKEYKETYVKEIHLTVWILMLLLSAYIFYDLFYL